jgi:hypothetical protein
MCHGAVLELESAIDKALSSAFGYGTPAYLRYNEAATLDPSPLLAKATVQAAVARPGGGPARQDAKPLQTRQHFSENKARAIVLLQKAIRTLEEEIADAEPVVAAPEETTATVIASNVLSEVPPKAEVRAATPGPLGGLVEALRRRVRRWRER